jgi:hypothetical protein
MIQNKVEKYWSKLSDIERYQLLNIALSYFIEITPIANDLMLKKSLTSILNTELPIDIVPCVVLKYIIDTAKYTGRYNNGG